MEVVDGSQHKKVRIEHLARHSHTILTLASWIRDEWGHSFLEAAFEELIADLKCRTTPHTIPETFVALEGDRLVGTASLVEHDMSTRLGLSPWLSAVYVPAEFRNRGIGSTLVRRAMQEAAILGVEQIYLFTPDKVSFYTRLGWTILEHTAYHGQDVVVMRYSSPAAFVV
jgi:N-acetylglutamate synthase-like GNAT family acetyltransferase